MEGKLVKDLQKELRSLIHKHHEEQIRNRGNLTSIAKMHEHMQRERVTPYSRKKLQTLYKTALQDAGLEAQILHKALNCIKEIRTKLNEKQGTSKSAGRPKEPICKGALLNMVQQRGTSIQLWSGKPQETPPPLCGAIPAEPKHIAKVGDRVAAFVELRNKSATWILSEVIKYDSSTNKYEVDDIDEEQQERRYFVNRSNVIPLPLMCPNPETHPEALFPKHAHVLALFPRTTCFYHAIVHEPPTKLHEDYALLFEDDTYIDGYSTPYAVCQQYVIAWKGKKK